MIVFGLVDVVVFGCLFIVNFDLVVCFCVGVLFNKFDCVIFYGGQEKGYIDYLMLEEVV